VDLQLNNRNILDVPVRTLGTMRTRDTAFNSSPSLTLLSQLLLSRPVCTEAVPTKRNDFTLLCELASSHHVVMRAMEVLWTLMSSDGADDRAEWALIAMAEEKFRIERALAFLYAICDALESEGCSLTVIKSLDHWPDLGSDLDLFTSAEPRSVIALMQKRFHAEIAPRSWGDRLANKWNFLVPGLPEAVEIHIGRLGQTGEEVAIAGALAGRARQQTVGGHTFRLPAAEDRLMLSTMQRMYRHFYFRLCDIVDSCSLVESGSVNYENLKAWASDAGIWNGVATYLLIVSDYVTHYRGRAIELPPFVRSSACFGGDHIRFGRGFLRVPIVRSVRLYASELRTLLRKKEIANTARLSLLPCLATAAALGQKLTGSDKGIW
jgi:hypothetical protein